MSKYMLICLCVICLMESGVFSVANARKRKISSNDTLHVLNHDGLERTYLVHLPRGYDGSRPLPLVLVLHGGGGRAETAVRTTGFNRRADQEHFIVIYPNGTGRTRLIRTWNATHCCGYAMKRKINDVGFIRTLIAKIEREYHIDPKRIYVAGMSNGGMMAHRLGIKLSDKLAAVGVVGSTLFGDEPSPRHPVSVIVFHGTADEHIPYHGGPGKVDKHTNHAKITVPDSVRFWVEKNGCSNSPKNSRTGHIEKDTYLECASGTGVTFYTIHQGGHAWPGGKKGSPWGDQPTRKISATTLIWNFFADHPKR